MENRLIFKNKELIDRDSRVLGISGENEQDTLVFKFADEFIDGTCLLELELEDGTKRFIETTKNEDSYSIVVKNSLLKQEGTVKMQLRIMQNDVEVWKCSIFEMLVLEAINATETLEQDYPNFVDETTAKLQELDERIDNINTGGIAEETDPTVPTHVKNITEQDIEKWNKNEVIISSEEPTTDDWKILIDEDEEPPEYVTIETFNETVGNIESLLAEV